MNNHKMDQEETVLQEPRTEAPESVETAGEKSGKPWKSVLLGGIPGILLGVGGVFSAQGFTLHSDEHTDEDTDTGSGHITHTSETDDKDIPVAQSPTDDMSFREAFDAAREEVGPGGAFSWHGNVYSTYRSDDPEWVEMGPDGQAAHCHDIVAQVQAEPYNAPVAGGNAGVEDSIDNNADDIEVTVEDTDDVDGGEVDVHIIGVENNPDGDGAAAYGYVDGHAAVFVDQDGDGEVDVVLLDVNNDGQLGEDEIISASGSGLSIDGLSQEVDTGNDVELYEGQPDYTNDVTPDFDNEGDISGF